MDNLMRAVENEKVPFDIQLKLYNFMELNSK